VQRLTSTGEVIRSQSLLPVRFLPQDPVIDRQNFTTSDISLSRVREVLHGYRIIVKDYVKMSNGAEVKGVMVTLWRVGWGNVGAISSTGAGWARSLGISPNRAHRWWKGRDDF